MVHDRSCRAAEKRGNEQDFIKPKTVFNASCDHYPLNRKLVNYIHENDFIYVVTNMSYR